MIDMGILRLSSWRRCPRPVVVVWGRENDDVAPLKGVHHGAPSERLGVTVKITRLA